MTAEAHTTTVTSPFSGPVAPIELSFVPKVAKVAAAVGLYVVDKMLDGPPSEAGNYTWGQVLELAKVIINDLR